MPLPKPRKGQKQDAFISSCMGNDTMKKEYPDNKQRLAVCHSQWNRKGKNMSNELEAREIFRTGTWNGVPFSEADLDDIAANFDKFKDKHNVPLKLGHNEEQKVTDGQPALGWVTRVYRDGKKLFADFSDVPSIVARAIKKRLYRNISIEVLFNVDNDGNRFNHVLDAVALLGADIPAVDSLQDLDALLATRTEFTGGRRVVFKVSEGDRKDEEFEMDKKEVEGMIATAVAPLEAANVKLAKENDDLKAKLKAKEDEDETREREAHTQKIAATRAEVKSILDKAVEDNNMTPAIRETYSDQIGLNDDDRVLDIDIKKVKVMCAATVGVDSDESGRNKGSSGSGDNYEGDEPSQELLRLTREYQHDHGEDNFQIAMSVVCSANPKLHRAYLDSEGEA
jgi:hypothetical protein